MRIVIIGAGTSAMTVADILVHDRNFKLAGFIGTPKEESELVGKKLYGDLPFLGDRSLLKKMKDDGVVGFIVAIGSNDIREKVYYEAIHKGLTPINAISHRAFIEPSARIGKGVIINAGCIVSHGVSIGNNTYLRSAVIVEINTEIGENCLIDSGCIVSGECKIGRNVKLGPRSTIGPYIKIGKNQSIKAGTVVKKDLGNLIRVEK
jgi:sugar O-acyltransferase (sialic acid O-acetyltransferase NeuD family)